jgi:hypothetical protein
VLAAQEPAGRGDRSSRVRISFGRPQGSGAAQARPGRDAGAREGAGFLRPKSDAEGWGGVAEEPLQARPPGGTAPRPGGEAGNEALGVARLRAQSRKSVEDERIVKQGTARVERIESDRDAQLRHYTGLPPSTWTPWNPGSATAPSGVERGWYQGAPLSRGSTGSARQRCGDAAHPRPHHRARHPRDWPIRAPSTLGSRGLRGRLHRCDHAEENHRSSDERRRRNGGSAGT